MLTKKDIETLKGIFVTKEEAENRFNTIDQRFDAIDKRFEAVNTRFDKLETEVVKLILAVSTLQHDMVEVKSNLSQINTTLDIVLKKLDRPWQNNMLEDHEKRIHRLELGRIDN